MVLFNLSGNVVLGGGGGISMMSGFPGCSRSLGSLPLYHLRFCLFHS
jgi:hypothetical protein